MQFQDHIEERLKQTTNTLGLSPLSREVLRVLAMVDCKDDLAEELRKADPYDRPGVLSWKTLAEQVPEDQSSLQPMEHAVITLADWGLIQIVGRGISDPIAPGPSALRLTYAGRVCIGLSPALNFRYNNTKLSESIGWGILHSASRERLYQAAELELSASTASLIIAQKGGDTELERLCGTVSIALCTTGHAFVDAFQISEVGHFHLIHELIRRTHTANAPRYILLPDPVFIRRTALFYKASIRWVEPQPHIRRDNWVLDKGTSDALLESTLANEEHDICGVPDSEIAQPVRCETKWDDLILAKSVQYQLRQAMQHAIYRLEILPKTQEYKNRKIGYRLLLSGLPGTGKSMTAEALATALDRPLVKLDLSTVLSKWLGETEKLIGQVFDLAEAANAVLVLDEAEALLRQRSNSSGSGGLSTGVAYMLTRFDRYSGVLVATTNRIEDLDEAFFRRFDDYAVLPIPDRPTRERMWQSMTGVDVPAKDINWKMLGRNFAISGGLIKGAVIRAKAWAIGMKSHLTTPYLLASLARELEKNNRSTNEVYIPEYRDKVEELLDGDERT